MITVTPAEVLPVAELYAKHLPASATAPDKVAFLKKHLEICFIASETGHRKSEDELASLEFAYEYGL